MSRRHVVDPSVTVIMQTVGINQDKIGRAIGSFCRQTYQGARLLIMNYHPQSFRLEGLPGEMRWRIDIVDAEDVFQRPVEQYIFNLKQVRTDCWTVLDDDDWIESNHIERLVSVWNSCSDRTDSPLRVCVPNYLAHYDEGPRTLRSEGWASSLFERLSHAEVDLCFKLFPAGNVCGSDMWIAGNSYWDRRVFEGPPTYNWDRTGRNHVSSHETNRGQTPRDNFKLALNYWRIKLEARASELKPVVVDTDEQPAMKFTPIE
jgi:hypothetical protein